MANDAPFFGGEGSPIHFTAERGARGERIAAEFLETKGFKVVARNWRNPNDEREEIDLVMLEQDILVFVEVKTRSADARVPGYFHVGREKKTVVRRAARAFLRRLGVNQKPRTFRFDIVEVELRRGGDPPISRHYRNIPLFLRQERA